MHESQTSVCWSTKTGSHGATLKCGSHCKKMPNKPTLEVLAHIMCTRLWQHHLRMWFLRKALLEFAFGEREQEAQQAVL